mgnify:CR=1 FL=1
MAIPLRSSETTQGRRMAGARALWRANGMTEEQIGKPVIAVVNSFTQFVPGHVHLHEIGQQVKAMIEEQGCFAAEFKHLGYRMVSGGTENHLVLIDLRSKGLTGALAETTLESVGIIVNRNVIPADPEKPEISSGIRIGSPAITSRGMQEPEVRQVARMMDTAMSNAENAQILKQVAQEVQNLCQQFPIQP